MPRSILNRLFARFARDERGNVSIEMVIWLPLILAVLGGTYALFEGFRQQSLNVKAAYTISDALSRQTEPVDDAYLDGMVAVLRFLTETDGQPGLRVTLVRYDAGGDDYDVLWSQGRGAFAPMTEGQLDDIAHEMPQLLHNERVIVVETETDHTPPFPGLGLGPDSFYNFVFTRPRFAPQIVWQG